jgi:hypothetical protein
VKKLLTLLLILLAGCGSKSSLPDNADDGLYINGAAAKTISLYGDCKKPNDNIYGPKRFSRVYRPEFLAYVYGQKLTLDIVRTTERSSYLEEFAGRDNPIL